MFLVLGVNVVWALGEYVRQALISRGDDLSLVRILASGQECWRSSVWHNLGEGLLESWTAVFLAVMSHSRLFIGR